MQWFKDFLNTFWDLLSNLAHWILDGLIYVIGWVFYQIFDGFLTVIHSFFAALDFSSVLFTHAAHWSDLPTQLIWLINQLALPQCLTIVSSALMIRVLMNLIPAEFTRV